MVTASVRAVSAFPSSAGAAVTVGRTRLDPFGRVWDQATVFHTEPETKGICLFLPNSVFPFHFLGFSLQRHVASQQNRELLGFGDSDEFFGVFVWGRGPDV